MPQTRPLEFKRILVPVDESHASRQSVHLACALAKRSHAAIRVLYVVEVKRALPLDAELSGEADKGEQVLAGAEQVAESLDYEVETELIQAREVGPAIVDEAIDQGADLIIISIEYRRRFGEFDMGAAVPYLLRNAPCEVWVCREPMVQ